MVWSNPNADDSVFIRAALMQPRFRILLDIANRFGLDRLKAEWRILEEEGALETRRAAPIVERILRNVAKGFALAAEAN